MCTGRQRPGDGVEERADLTVDDDGVQPLLATEVLVDHGLGDTGTAGDLLDGRCLETPVGKQLPADDDELLATLLSRHPGPCGGRSVLVPGCSHHAIVPNGPPSPAPRLPRGPPRPPQGTAGRRCCPCDVTPPRAWSPVAHAGASARRWPSRAARTPR